MEQTPLYSGMLFNMQEYQNRVINEQYLLEEKAQALYGFLSSKKFDELDKTDQFLLKQQYYAMMVYSGILQQRIDRF